MYRNINWKAYRLLYVVIVTLTVSVSVLAQTPERVIDRQQPVNQKKHFGWSSYFRNGDDECRQSSGR